MNAGTLEIQLLSNIARLQKDMTQAKSVVSGSMTSIESSVNSAKNVLASLGAGLSIGLLAGKLKSVIVETDSLRGSLVTMTGSLGASTRAFDDLTKFAAKTPFTLDQSVNAFIKLKALGLDPSERALMSYGNTASAMGKQMSQMIEAVADAATGEFERLKEFGIKAKSEGDNVTFTFQGVSTTVKKEADAIQGYLLEIGETKFGDAMANQMERLPGLLSNLQDSVDSLFRTIGDSGATSIFGSAIKTASGIVVGFTENLDTVAEVAKLLAAVLTARLVSSVAASGAAFVVATGQSIAYQAALARMAGVSGTAAAAQTALGVATGVANTALTLMGGPVGAIVIATYAAYKLGTAIHDNARETATYTEVLERNNAQLKIGADRRTAIYLMGIGQQEAAAALTLETDKAAHALKTYTTNVEGFVGPHREMNTVVEGFVGPMRAAGVAVYSYGKDVKFTSNLLDAHVDALNEYRKAQEKAAEEVVNAKKKTEEKIKALQNEQLALGMTARAQAIFNAASEEYARNTAPEEIAQIVTLVATNYDLAEAQRVSTKAASDHEAAQVKAAAAAQRQWETTRDYLADTFVDIMNNGQSAFKQVGDFAVATAKRIVAEWAAVKALEFVGIKSPMGSTGTSGSLLSSIATSAGGKWLGSLLGGGGGNAVVAEIAAGGVGGVGGVAGTTAATTGASAGMGSTMVALASNPATWAVAALALAAKNGFWKNPDDYTRSFAGMLTGPTPGAAGSTFGVDPFASGFRAQGIAHNASQSEALNSISVFRELDSSIVALVKELGGVVDASKATFAGTGIDGIAGTSGTFVGMGGKTTEADLKAMVDLYATQLTSAMGGLDSKLLDTVKSATSAEEIITILSAAAKDMTDTLATAEVEVTNMDKAREQASNAILNAYNSGITELDSIQKAYSAFQQYAERGLTAAMIAQSTGIMESEINSVIARGAAMNTASAPANNSGWSGFSGGFDLWGETAKNAYTPDAEFAAAIKASFLAAGMDQYGQAIDGSHADGMPFIPFDGYVARTHYGERILTADENKDYSKGGSNGAMANVMQGVLMELADIRKLNSGIYNYLDKWDGQQGLTP